LAAAGHNLSGIESVTDYLLVTTDGTTADTDDTCDPAGAGSAVQLAANLTLGVLDATLARRLMRACELRGERWDPDPLFGVAQAFVHAVDPGVAVDRQQLHAWDPDHVLFSALSLSRLVRPHAIACDYAVRRLVETTGPSASCPTTPRTPGWPSASSSPPGGWLDAKEAEQLGILLSAYAPEHLPGRVRRAWWQCESMVRERYLEDTLLIIVSGLESLLKVGRRRVTAQFVQRTTALAAEFSIALTETHATAGYDDRSGISHGAATDLTHPTFRTDFVERTDLLQQTLRAAVRRAIEDPAFAALFASDAMIRGQWPVRPT
jgi:hypothetical protein